MSSSQDPSGPAPGWPPYRRPTNTMAVLALVFAFVAAPVGLVLGIVARKQIKQTGEQGWGLSTAGLWLGYIFTGFYVAICAFYVIAIIFVSSNSGSTY